MSRAPASQSNEHIVELVSLVDRITYGVDGAQLGVADSLGYEGYVEWQLDDENIDDSELESILESFLPTLTMSASELADYVFEQENFGAPLRDLTVATLIRQVFSARQLYERMVEFWSDHFNAPALSQIGGFFKLLEDRDTIRSLAMTSFGELLSADAKSPAMLYYLDNYNNTAEGPNENYARELLELHTLGIDGGYTEDDIKDTARVFTGWSIREPADFVFYEGAHDWGSKHVLGRGFDGAGVGEGEALLAILADSESTARHVVTKLARRFSADVPEAQLVDSGVDAYLTSSGDIRQTLRAILLHPQLRGQAALKLKRPNEFAAGALRALRTELEGDALGALFEAVSSAGQQPFVWPAPDGYPDRREYWQSTTGLQMRFNTAFSWARDFGGYSQVIREAGSLDDLIDQAEFLVSQLQPKGLSGLAMRRLLNHAHHFDPTERPAALAGWLLASPEAQWR